MAPGQVGEQDARIRAAACENTDRPDPFSRRIFDFFQRQERLRLHHNLAAGCLLYQRADPKSRESIGRVVVHFHVKTEKRIRGPRDRIVCVEDFLTGSRSLRNR
jgi:hypothetical protein